jgi:primosomal protein N' (replication factor Y)
MQRGAVAVNEQLKRGFQPRTETFIRLSEAYQDEAQLQTLFDELKRAKKQEQLMIRFLHLNQTLNPSLLKEVSRKELLSQSDIQPTALQALVKRGALELYEKEVSRIQPPICQIEPIHKLSEEQAEAWQTIRNTFKTKDVCLLHGVTSSGKTEIYAHLIEEVLSLGRQVLYLLPEIAITTQLTERLSRHFGDRLLVYHSGYSDNERVEIWNKLLYDPSPRLILGVRSALFLPYKDLGLIIVDEEQEYTFKQQDPAPRYHARNAGIVLASMHGAKTLLGSATPSIDSYFNATIDKYGLAELKHRYANCQMPEILIADLKELRRKKQMKDSLFSPVLQKKIQEALDNDEQVILFQNRRGFAPMLECHTCGWVPHCIHCDVSLTWHKPQHRMVCHYCGYSTEIPAVCPACESTDLRSHGFGTQKVEEEISQLFPDINAARLDIDSARSRIAYERILSDFEKEKIRILIGTQMISKGLDFGNVSVVGILNADSLMNFPDFRSHERAFQLMVQVSGRAGRRDKRGTVVLQTTQPDHLIIRMVQQSTYKEMVTTQLQERSMFRYPPYFRLIEIVMRSRNEAVLREYSMSHAEKLREKLGERVLGPVTPVINRIQTLYIRKIIIKIEVAAPIAPVREILENVRNEIQMLPQAGQVLIHYNVDPL